MLEEKKFFSLSVKIFLILTFLFMTEKSPADSLSDIASTGTAEEVRVAFSGGENVEKIYQGGETPLMFAAANNPNVNVIQTLVSLGSNVNASDDVGLTPLMFSVTTNKSAGLTYALLRYGADVNASDKDGVSVIMYAARDAAAPVVEMIIAGGADVNAMTTNGWTPLMYAAMSNRDVRVMELLLEAGTQVLSQNAEGMSVLMIAAQNTKNPDTIELLLRHSADTTLVFRGKRAIDFARRNPSLKGTAALRNLERTTQLRLSEKQ